MRYFISAVLTVLAVNAFSYWLDVTSRFNPPPLVPAFQMQYEDEPGWNCRTMGNLVCGPDFILRNVWGS